MGDLDRVGGKNASLGEMIGRLGNLGVRVPGGFATTAQAFRSSVTAEDLPEASFAGQQETFLNVQGAEAVLQSVKNVSSSLFTDRAISYRVHHGFRHAEVAVSAGVQRMVRSDLGASGVMFTLDTESGFPDVVLITATYGRWSSRESTAFP